MSGGPQPRRRDFLTTIAFGATGVGLALASWPFIAAMNPAEDTRWRHVIFKLSELRGDKPAFVDVAGTPILVFRRTDEELAWLRNPPFENQTRDPYSPVGYAFRDRDSNEPRQPAWAKNWRRSLRPEIMVCSARCTREGCVVHRRRSNSLFPSVDNQLQCPCCGSAYDLAGRAFSGPARLNLTVPDHQFIDEETIGFPEYARS
jgi:ubiquinol-cytochrome c reductase iron-sulfur subunit